MNLHLRTLPLAAVLGLALVAGCDPKSPKVTEDPRPTTGTEQATGTITGSTGTATGTGGAGSTTTPGTPSGTLPEASGPAISAGSEPTAGRSTGAPLGTGGSRATGGATATDSHSSTAGEPGRSSGVGAGATAPPSVAVPASRTASMAAGAADMANQPAAPANRGQATPGGDAPSRDAASQSAPKLSAAERTFMQNAAGLGLYEMAAAQLGQARAKSPAVRAFAEQMQRDHAKAQEQLQEVARRHGVELPGQMPPDRQTVIERLERTEPFDVAFVNTVGVQDHRSVIERFEKAQRDAKDPALQGWIKQTLPALREHLAHAGKLPGANAEAKSR